MESIKLNSLPDEEQAKLYIDVYLSDIETYKERIVELDKDNIRLDEIYYNVNLDLSKRIYARKCLAENTKEICAIEWSIEELESKIKRLNSFIEN